MIGVIPLRPHVLMVNDQKHAPWPLITRCQISFPDGAQYISGIDLETGAFIDVPAEFLEITNYRWN